ncbi:hypothetical protein GFB56_12310 [Ensifer sp. T173]|uniref:Uncharacterized protein n=1 Tax=Ensifer canadensis TaxID=555315 RepID=A0AAW4FKM6_9HYPH|nr:hypothetical protein [Ensifer canadensis]MBM3091599.1 hypothetical protein [Ensifer canadensis]UBI74416.1 hypothetical protein J3R84_13045 [Ensifer canadensis]
MTDKLPTWAWAVILAVAIAIGYSDIFDDQTVFFFLGIGVAVYLGIKIDEAKNEVEDLKRRLEDAERRLDRVLIGQ